MTDTPSADEKPIRSLYIDRDDMLHDGPLPIGLPVGLELATSNALIWREVVLPELTWEVTIRPSSRAR